MRYPTLRLTVALIGCLSCSGTAITPPTQYGSINGSVTSSLSGGIAGAIVVITPTGMAALAADTTKASGSFSASTVPIANGSGTVAVSNVPSNCSAPRPTSYNITIGRPTTVPITVQCVTPVDSVGGTITASTGGTVANVVLVVTPNGDTTHSPVTTSNAGTWVVAPVNVTGGSITLSNIPNNCVTPSPLTYTSKASGGLQVVNITLTCSTSGVAAITGTVTSSQGGAAMAGLGVVVTPHGGTALPSVPTNASGVFTATGVPIADGTGAITFTNVPSNCPAPAATNYTTLTNGTLKTVNIVVACNPPAGTVSGTISSSAGGGLAAIGVVITPLNGTPTPSVTTSNSGQYTVNNVPLAGSGQGSLAITNLPSNCAPLTTPPTYTGLTNSGTVTLNVTVTCSTPIGVVKGLVTDLGKPAFGFYATITPTNGQPVNSPIAYPVPGLYQVNVPVGDGTGTVSLNALPVNCTAPAPQKYSGLANQGYVTIDFAPSCNNTGGVDVIVSTLTTGVPLPNNIGNAIVRSGSTVSPAITQSLIVANLSAGYDTVIGNPSLSLDQTVATQYVNDSTTHKIDTIVVAKLDTTIVYYDPNLFTGGLWIADSASQLLSDFSGPQLRQGGSLTPANLEELTTTAAPTGMAINDSGYFPIWVSLGQSNQVVRYSFGLGQGVPFTTFSSGLSDPQGLAFDAAGNLWVANAGSNTVVGLTSAGVVKATVSSSALSTPTGVAFDANGNLWVSNAGNNTIVEFSASQIASGGTLTPPVVISATGSSLVTPTAVAFDANGTLWVANTGGGTVVGFSSSQLGSSGTPTPTSTIRTASGMTTPHGLAFDLGGNLWVVDVASHSVLGFGSGQIAAGGTLSPTSVVKSNGGSLQAGVAIAFNPHATNLPLH